MSCTDLRSDWAPEKSSLLYFTRAEAITALAFTLEPPPVEERVPVDALGRGVGFVVAADFTVLGF